MLFLGCVCLHDSPGDMHALLLQLDLYWNQQCRYFRAQHSRHTVSHAATCTAQCSTLHHRTTQHKTQTHTAVLVQHELDNWFGRQAGAEQTASCFMAYSPEYEVWRPARSAAHLHLMLTRALCEQPSLLGRWQRAEPADTGRDSRQGGRCAWGTHVGEVSGLNLFELSLTLHQVVCVGGYLSHDNAACSQIPSTWSKPIINQLKAAAAAAAAALAAAASTHWDMT